MSDRKTTDRTLLKQPFHHMGNHGWMVSDVCSGGDDSANAFRSNLCLYEGGVRLLDAHEPHWAINDAGGGRYSHWQQSLCFSTTDGSDPNTNGKRYEFDHSLDLAAWNRGRLIAGTKRWTFHPRGDYFRSRGGDLIPPPLYCNIGLTNKCNLRCEICGSQKALDETGTRRRHMEFEVFEGVAETIFPFLRVVELNSQGDPLLHPRISDVLARIAQHGCDVKIQHNGTLLTDRIVDILLQQHGTIMLSLDAVGSRFDEVRRGGNWARAITGLERLLRERDPQRLAIGAYPTLTGRTIGEALNIVEWCANHRVDEVVFHRYSPIANSFEVAPNDDEYGAMKEQVREWCRERQDPLRIAFESESLNDRPQPIPGTRPATPEKAPGISELLSPQFPTELDGPLRSQGGDPVYVCAAPRDYVEIGLDGQISACCRAQDIALGYATSVEAFADAWLGANYERIRASLLRGANGPYPLPNCEDCVKFFAPTAAGDRRAINYRSPESDWRGGGLDLRIHGDVRLDRFRQELGHCYVSTLPIGVDASDMELWEEGWPLGPAGSLHDDIRAHGRGRYSGDPLQVYFSTSDNSDPRRNDRNYVLRSMGPLVSDDGSIRLRTSWFAKEIGHCCIASLPTGLIAAVDMELWEDDLPLEMPICLHADIRAFGNGRYHVSEIAVYFASSDNSDARFNRRRYTLKPKAMPGLTLSELASRRARRPASIHRG